MMKKCFEILRALNVFAMAAALMAGLMFAPVADCAPKSAVVARVNGVDLTEIDLNNAYNTLVPAAVFHGGLSDSKREKYRGEALDIIVLDELYYREALRRGIDADPKALDAKIDKNVKRFKNKKAFKAAVAEAGLTLDQYREINRKELVLAAFKKALDAEAVVSDAEAAEYYNANLDKFMLPESRRVRHILVKVDPSSSQPEALQRLEYAKSIYTRIVDGADFAQMAWDFSDDDSKVKGGDLGLVHKGRLVPEVEEMAWKLKPGEISEPVKSMYGFHIVKVDEILEPRQMTMGESMQSLKASLEKKKAESIKEELDKKLRSGAKIEIIQ